MLRAGPPDACDGLEPVAWTELEHRSRASSVHLEGEPRPVRDHGAPGADGFLEARHRQGLIAEVGIDSTPAGWVGEGPAV